MFNTVKKLILVFSALTFFGFLNEANAEVSSGQIKRIYPSGDRVYFRLKNDNCLSGSQYYYFEMDDNSDKGKYAAPNWYTMLIASAHANKTISVKVSSCPQQGHAQVIYLYQDY